MGTYVSSNYTWPANSTTPSATHIGDVMTRLQLALNACGLVQTADTGQCNPASPAAWNATLNTLPNWFIYRFNDAQQATDPIFIKIGPSVQGGGPAYWAFRMYVGQGSDGASNLTGSISTLTGGSGVNATGNFPQRSTAQIWAGGTDGAFFLAGDYAHEDARVFGNALSIERMRKPDGTYDGRGVSMMHTTQDSNNQTVWRAVAHRWGVATYNTQQSCCIVPGQPANTADANGFKQLYPHFYNSPEVRQRWSSFTVRNSEFAANATSFIAAPFGGVSRTFLHPGSAGLGYWSLNVTDDANFGPCFLWE